MEIQMKASLVSVCCMHFLYTPAKSMIEEEQPPWNALFLTVCRIVTVAQLLRTVNLEDIRFYRLMDTDLNALSNQTNNVSLFSTTGAYYWR